MKVKTLHVLEHPSLHGKPSTDPPVHVIWEPHEFDFWQVTQRGDLQIGTYSYRTTPAVGILPEETYREHAVKMVIQHGMFAKVWEEEVEYPDAVGSATVDEPQPYVDPLHAEDGPELAPWNYDEHPEPEPLHAEDVPELAPWNYDEHPEPEPGVIGDPLTDTGEHGEPLVERAVVTHLDEDVTDSSPVEVITVAEPDAHAVDYTDKTVINAEPIQYGDLGRIIIPQKMTTFPPREEYVDEEKKYSFESTPKLGVDREYKEYIDKSDAFPRSKPGYGWPSGSYAKLGDVTGADFKIPEGNTFFDDEPAPEVPEVFSESPKRDLNETRIDLPRFLSPEPKSENEDATSKE